MSSRVTTGIQKLLSSFKSIEALLECKDEEAIQVVNHYLVNRLNSELLECFLFIKNCNNTHVNNVETYREFYRIFIDVNSTKSLNLPSQITQQSSNLFQQCIETNIICNHQLLTIKIENIVKTILNLIEYQFNVEILPQFKKSPEYSTFIISKVIEFGNQQEDLQSNSSEDETSSNNEESISSFNDDHDKTRTIEQILQEGNMTEHFKSFQKKKLVYLYQIKNFTTQDFKDKIGIKKIGHLKRIVRLINHYYSNKPNDLSL